MTARATCSLPREIVTPQFMEELNSLSIKPIETPFIVRVVYEGPDSEKAQRIVDLFKKYGSQDVYVSINEGRRKNGNRKA